MLSNVIYNGKEYKPEDMMFRIILFKIFNTEPTWQECDFTIPGGGAKRGIAKVFKSLGGLSEEQAIWYMYDHQEEEFAKRGYNFHKLGNKRRMQPIDCQNVFCETDKYCREAHPELKSACAQIKNTYTKSKPSINFIYPPKWGLDFTNDKK